jgi:hypothetical protein
MSTITRLTKAQRLRAELAHLRARYDHGAVSPEMYSVIRELESELAWVEHRGRRETSLFGFGEVGHASR